MFAKSNALDCDLNAFERDSVIACLRKSKEVKYYMFATSKGSSFIQVSTLGISRLALERRKQIEGVEFQSAPSPSRRDESRGLIERERLAMVFQCDSILILIQNQSCQTQTSTKSAQNATGLPCR